MNRCGSEKVFSAGELKNSSYRALKADFIRINIPDNRAILLYTESKMIKLHEIISILFSIFCTVLDLTH